MLSLVPRIAAAELSRFAFCRRCERTTLSASCCWRRRALRAATVAATATATLPAPAWALLLRPARFAVSCRNRSRNSKHRRSPCRCLALSPTPLPLPRPPLPRLRVPLLRRTRLSWSAWPRARRCRPGRAVRRCGCPNSRRGPVQRLLRPLQLLSLHPLMLALELLARLPLAFRLPHRDSSTASAAVPPFHVSLFVPTFLLVCFASFLPRGSNLLGSVEH